MRRASIRDGVRLTVTGRPTPSMRLFVAGGHRILLRPLSDVDDGRVKAYRKSAESGELPPVLLWWQSGFFVLDGHDRLVAAAGVGVSPPVVVLSRAGDGQPREGPAPAGRAGTLGAGGECPVDGVAAARWTGRVGPDRR